MEKAGGHQNHRLFISCRNSLLIGYPWPEQMTESIPHRGQSAVRPPVSSTQSLTSSGENIERQKKQPQVSADFTIRSLFNERL